MSYEPAIDRRIARTRASLRKALMSLILRKPYEAITITDICEAANVSRSTFYAHFTDKDDLKRSGLDTLRRELARDAVTVSKDAEISPLSFSLAMFEHARAHIDHYRALVGNHGGTVALGHIRQIIADLLRDEFAATGIDKDRAPNLFDVPRDLAVQHIVGAYMAVLTWWLDDGARLSVNQIDAAFRRLALHGIRASEIRKLQDPQI